MLHAPIRESLKESGSRAKSPEPARHRRLWTPAPGHGPVAGSAFRLSEANLRPSQGGLLQRKCACGGTPGPTGECAACRAKRLRLERRSADQAEPSAVPPIVDEVLSSPSQPLDPATRAFMEPRLGYDFGHVRIHNDERAGESARSVGAFAYTVGNLVVLDRAWYAPHTPKGLHLLAHELAHVVQQRPGGARQVPDRIGRANDSAEREAEYVADAVVGASGGAGADVRTTTGAPADRYATLRRLTRTALVTCPVGQNPHGADRRASKFLEDAINLIGRAQAARPANPADPDVVAVGNALRVAFRLDPASAATWTAGAPQIRLPVITRRLQMAKNYIDSVVFTVTCRGA